MKTKYKSEQLIHSFTNGFLIFFFLFSFGTRSYAQCQLTTVIDNFGIGPDGPSSFILNPYRNQNFGVGPGRYNLTRSFNAYANWVVVPNEPSGNGGRFLIVDGFRGFPNFYSRGFTVCPNITYTFSANLLNLDNLSYMGNSAVSFQIFDGNNNLIAVGNTPVYPTSATAVWNNFSFSFNPGNNTNLTLVVGYVPLINGSMGNSDYAFDDFQVTANGLCATFPPIGPLCKEAIPPSLPGTSNEGIPGTWSPATINTTASGTTTYTFTPNAGQCATTSTLDITITPQITPTFSAIGPLCQNSVAPALPLSSTNGTPITGTWNPSTINTSNAGTTTYTFTPNAGQCATTSTLDITITPQITPTFSTIGPLCQNSVAPALPLSSTNGINGTWNPATINTSANGTTTYTFTPNAGQCASITTMDITINNQLTPTFGAIGPFCLNSTPPTLPASSTNGISGTWSPSSINTSATGTGTYTFTPNSGQCAMTTTLDITVTNQITPTFAAIGPLCQNSTAPSLPSSSTNSTPISGTWSPATISTTTAGTTTYTFTPNVGQCATTTTLNITVSNQIIPTFAAIGPLCQNSTAPLLPSSSTNSTPISGTWSPATISTTTAGTITYTFTPNAGQCAATSTLNITISPQVMPTIAASESTICSGSSATLTVNGAVTYSAWAPTTNLTGSGKTVVVSPTANTTYTVMATTSIGCSKLLSVPITVQNCGSCCANTCPWTLSGNSAVNSPTRATITLTSSCTTNNFVGTRAGNQAENNDVVFGSNGFAYMRLTTDGGLFLSDFPQLYGSPRYPERGNIKIGWSAGLNLRLNDPVQPYPGSNNSNIVIGHNAARDATMSGSNILIGNGVGFNTTAAPADLKSNNIFIGSGVASNMHGITPCASDVNCGSYNIALGINSAQNIQNGNFNNFFGYMSGRDNTDGTYNTFVGTQAGLTNNTGNVNTFVGANAGGHNTQGSENIYIGGSAGANATTASKNIFIGNRAGDGTYSTASNTGTENTCIGYETASGINTGSQNTYIGTYTAARNLSGNLNTYIGYGVGGGVGAGNTASNSTCIGASINMSGVNNVCIGSNSGYVFGGPSNHDNCISIGNANQVIGNYAISIGTAAEISPQSQNHTSAGSYSIAIGSNTRANSANSVAIGEDASSGGVNTFVIGTAATLTPPTPATAPPLNVGIGTSLPLTRFHVNCTNDPRNPTPNNGSAILFGGLQTGTGTTLVIDNSGYVYKSTDALPGIQANCNPSTIPAYQVYYNPTTKQVYYDNPACKSANTNPGLSDTKTDSLLQLIQTLQQKLSTLEKDMDKCCAKGISNSTDIPFNQDIKLYQNIPNPFDQTTEIRLFIPEIVKKASLVIYDLQGKELRKMEITDRNEASVKIYAKEFAAGMYIYTLIADDKEIDSKRMILTGN